MATLFHRRFNLIWPAVGQIRQALLHVLGGLSVDENDIDNAGLVMTEYLTNLLRHCRGEDEAITLVISEQAGAINVMLIDPTPYFKLMCSEDGGWQVNSGDLVEGGMGLALIRHSFPNYQYVNVDGKNQFSFSVSKNTDKKKVVLLDDDLTLLPLLSAYLSERYSVSVFSEPDDALHYLKHSQNDLLITDFNFPNTTAIEVIEQIRAFKTCTEMAIILMSSDHQPETIHQANQSYIDDYLLKPLLKTHLHLVCDRVLKRKQQQAMKHAQTSHNEACKNQAINSQLTMWPFGSVVSGNGGDFLLLKTDKKQSILILADVMGHGLAAKKESYALKGFIQGFLGAVSNDIAKMMNALSQAIYEEKLLHASLVTLLVLQINERCISWISAGHPLPLEVDKNRKGHCWGDSQPLLGLSSEHCYQTTQQQLPQGHHLLLYTDGWFENTSKEQTAEKQVFEIVQRIGPSDYGNNFANALWQKSFPNLHQEIDDSSLVVLN